MCFRKKAIELLKNVACPTACPTKESVEGLIELLHKNFSQTVQSQSDSDATTKILMRIRNILNQKAPDINLNAPLIIKTANTAFLNSYYRIAYEILLFVENNASENEDYLCLNADILSMSGQYLDAVPMLEERMKTNPDSPKTIETYGRLLIDNLPINECLRRKWLKNYIELLGGNSELYSDIPIANYYIGRCYEELFNCDGNEHHEEKANDYLLKYINQYNHKSDPEILVAMEARWAMARIAIQHYYSAVNTEKKERCKDTALQHYQEALTLVKDFPVFNELTKGYMDYFSASIQPIDPSSSQILTHNIMNSQEMRAIEKVYYHDKRIRKRFICERYRLRDRDKPQLEILQRWNSYTPILADVKAPSRGGGYYIDTGTKGIVIDPGFDFIKNFREAGHFLTDIDYVFITHAHNDHSADLESLITLLHMYNTKEIRGDKYALKNRNTIYQQMLREYPRKEGNEIEKLVEKEYERSPRRKRFTIALSQSTNKKFSFLDISKEADFKIKIIDTSPSHIDSHLVLNIASTDETVLSCSVIYAKHHDLISDAHCVGFVFSHSNISLVYTGDTGFDDTIKELYEKLKSKSNSSNIILLAHIGGFKNEEKYNLHLNHNQYYKNHLGRLGLIELIEILDPQLCIISEFGEEFRGNCRVDLANLFNSEIQKIEKETVFVPADLGLKVQFDMKINAIDKAYKQEGDMVTEGYIDYRDISFFEDNILPEYPIYYFKKGILTNNPSKSVIELQKRKEAEQFSLL